jgi:hypothetical protein
MVDEIIRVIGKVNLIWNPMDTLPVFPPQIQQVQHPFMANQTVNNNTEKYVGSFNQTFGKLIDMCHPSSTINTVRRNDYCTRRGVLRRMAYRHIKE